MNCHKVNQKLYSITLLRSLRVYFKLAEQSRLQNKGYTHGVFNGRIGYL